MDFLKNIREVAEMIQSGRSEEDVTVYVNYLLNETEMYNVEVDILKILLDTVYNKRG